MAKNRVILPIEGMSCAACAATVQEALAQTLTDQERDRFEEHMRAVLAAGTPARKILATAYLRAIRP